MTYVCDVQQTPISNPFLAQTALFTPMTSHNMMLTVQKLPFPTLHISAPLCAPQAGSYSSWEVPP